MGELEKENRNGQPTGHFYLINRNDLREILKEVVDGAIKEAIKYNVNGEKTVYNMTEAAKFINVCRRTLYTYTQNGTIPCSQRGKKYSFKKKDLLKFIEPQNL